MSAGRQLRNSTFRDADPPAAKNQSCLPASPALIRSGHVRLIHRPADRDLSGFYIFQFQSPCHCGDETRLAIAFFSSPFSGLCMLCLGSLPVVALCYAVLSAGCMLNWWQGWLQPRQQAPGDNSSIRSNVPLCLIMLRREATQEEVFEAYEYLNTKRVGLPLPKKAPKIEATVFDFDKDADATGSYRGDLLKRAVFQVEDLIGDKRREIYHLLPMKKDNHKHINNLGSQLAGLYSKLLKKIREFKEQIGITLEVPQHFKKFPELED